MLIHDLITGSLAIVMRFALGRPNVNMENSLSPTQASAAFRHAPGLPIGIRCKIRDKSSVNPH